VQEEALAQAMAGEDSTKHSGEEQKRRTWNTGGACTLRCLQVLSLSLSLAVHLTHFLCPLLLYCMATYV
jgi:hypothetical protein